MTMRIPLRISIICLLSVFLSCEEGDWFKRKCEDCLAEEPLTAPVKITLSPLSYSNYFPTLSIYEGNLEDSILIDKFETSSTSFTRGFSVNKKYTIVARYYVYGTYYEAINSFTTGVVYERFMCVSPCYRITDNNCDLRLKYQ
jgi:hypothetical protein